MSAPLYLAVDGGNSKTDVVFGDAGGGVRAFLRGPTASPDILGVPGAMAMLDRLVGAARTRAGLPAGAPVARADLLLAGADLPSQVARLTREAAALGWAAAVRVDNDAFALLRAGTAHPDAVVVVCGAGSNCLGRRADGRTARFPAFGPLSGDWGGGHHLAELALWHAARAEDGRGPASALVAAVTDYFGLATVERVSAALHLGEVPRERLYGLSEALFAVAAAGDPVAAKVVRRQADEVLAQIRVAAGRLDLLGRAFAVVLGGGVLAARHPLLHDAIVAGLADLAPAATVSGVADRPAAGAALLAADALHGGATPAEVEERVRSALREKPAQYLG
ncbi:N-acetylglucosamine kinase [Rhizomonospora bruguierae]|uniref:N-acetylglucosamine kinase n=1 Tax=Rhizomonospora bruguierae TaxID=1581705 RepID=UPI001BD16779|nr:BadF/BadG/BcrA/BcrD ATPase family protein [Micromonospora sp. NBRC 107566]